MRKTLIINLLLILILFAGCSQKEKINLVFNLDSPVLQYAANRLKQHLASQEINIQEQESNGEFTTEIFLLTPETAVGDQQKQIISENISTIEDEGFSIKKDGNKVFIVGKSPKGCLYGTMELIEQLGSE